MFDLEKSIVAWRKQMLAAGIQSPVPMEELEVHLREEISRAVEAGANPQAAFAIAAACIGSPDRLKIEFKKDVGIAGMIGAGPVERTNRLIGLLWLIYCLGSFYHTTSGLMSVFPHVQITPLFVFAWLMDFIYLRGVVASVLLFNGVMRERRYIFMLAILDALGGAGFLLSHAFQPLCFIFTVLGFVTIRLFWPWQKTKTATA
ncbi:MAG TPA: hypothetical protein VK742_18390 [Candidatus Sulfotelmatobacter sp.]|jgi:hypothetical protein|nr:hypothetical protein [Candidatus Sulfotelmatobacter sp.]